LRAARASSSMVMPVARPSVAAGSVMAILSSRTAISR
jgi:hypothetical protein